MKRAMTSSSAGHDEQRGAVNPTLREPHPQRDVMPRARGRHGDARAHAVKTSTRAGSAPRRSVSPAVARCSERKNSSVPSAVRAVP